MPALANTEHVCAAAGGQGKYAYAVPVSGGKGGLPTGAAPAGARAPGQSPMPKAAKAPAAGSAKAKAQMDEVTQLANAIEKKETKADKKKAAAAKEKADGARRPVAPCATVALGYPRAHFRGVLGLQLLLQRTRAQV